VKSVIYKDNSFYIMANKKNKKLGYYLVKIDAYNPLENLKNPDLLEK
jgi:hypothetical protein